MEEALKSPRITGLSWGRLEVDGVKSYKDAKLFSGGSREWDWTETGTNHAPGIQPGDVEELIRHGATVIVLSQGQHGRLQISPETLQMLKQRKIPVHVLSTPDAVRRYNQLRGSHPVGGLFHTTC